MRIVLLNGKRKTENGNLRVSESRSKVHFDYAERKQIRQSQNGKHHERKTENGKRKAGRLSNGTRKVCESMVGTRHAVSENKSVLGVPFPQRHYGKCPPPLYLLGFLKTYSLYFPFLLFITLPPLVLGHGMPCPYRHAFAFRSKVSRLLPCVRHVPPCGNALRSLS